jgi:hypothetical protein
MIKKLMLLAMAVGLVVFAAPAFASAAPLVTDLEGGTATSVTATQDPEDPVITHLLGGLGQLECSAIDLSIGLESNEEESAMGSGTGTATGCHDGLAPVNITEINVSTITLNAGGTGSASFTFKYDVPALGLTNCEFSGTVGLSFVTNSSTITITEPNALTGSAGCPPAATITGSFVLDDAELM